MSAIDLSVVHDVLRDAVDGEYVPHEALLAALDRVRQAMGLPGLGPIEVVEPDPASIPF